MVIANRTLEEMVKDFSVGKSAQEIKLLRASSLEIDARPFDIVINGTSASLGGEMPDLDPAILNPNACCYDMMYGTTDAIFAVGAAQRCASRDGLGMLVEQAAKVFICGAG